MKLLIIFLFVGNVLTASADEFNNGSEKNNSYLECSAPISIDIKSIFGAISSDDFTDRLSIAEVLQDLLNDQNKYLTEFLSNKERINELDYVERALDLFMYDGSYLVDCFYKAFQEKDVIYRFIQETSDGLVKGFAIIEKNKIKVVLYKTVIMI